MKRYLSVSEMIAIEKASDSMGHTYPKMMAHAGKSLAEAILFRYGELENRSVLGLVGSGNNGGDTLVAMSLLLKLGWECSAYLTSEREADELTREFIEAGGDICRLKDDDQYQHLRSLVFEKDILLDGLLGTGIKLPLREPIGEVLEIVNQCLDLAESKPEVVAVDCPSGIDCDTGEAAEACLAADLTVCMAAVKQGLLKLPAYDFIGELVVGEIGLPADLPELDKIKRFVIDRDYVISIIPKRPSDGYKGTFGTVLVIAGSKHLPGAAILAGKSAFRSGAGWVNIAVPEQLQPFLIGYFPEATWLPLPSDENGFIRAAANVVNKSLTKETTVLLGPGFGLGNGVKDFLNDLLKFELPPLVIDADGLKLLANIDQWWEQIPAKTILTPHPGEMSILTGIKISAIQENRIEMAEKFSAQWGHVVVLKGAFTVISEPDGRTAILPIASPALARAGTGDVLAGIISGLRAQGIPAFESAVAGVWLHAQAGLAAAEALGSTAGVLAGDLIEMLPGLMPY